MSKIRFGVAGIGTMGGFHAKYIDNGQIPDAELAAVCDPNPDRLDWAKDNLSKAVKRFDTPEAMFASKSIDAVLIAMPHYDHPALAIKAFEHNLHVLTEKPAGSYTKQVRLMNQAAEKSDRVFGIMFNQRSLPIFSKIKDLVDSDELGAIQRTNWIITTWFRTQRYFDNGGWRATWAGEGGGVLLNQCPHQLDLWQWICGMPNRVRAFCAFGKYHNIEVEDDVTAYVEYENGATGVFITTTGEAPGTNRFEIIGDRGKLIAEDDKLTFHRTRTSASEFIRESDEAFGTPETWTCQIPLSEGQQQHAEITKDFVRAIVDKTPLLAPGIDGVNSLELSNAMILSTWTDKWIPLPLDDDLYHEKLQEKIKTSTYQKKEVKTKAANPDSSF